MKTVSEDVISINLRSFNEDKGSLIPIESGIDCLIDIERLFYVYKVPKGGVRGKHAHIETVQVLICLKGVCEVTCDDGKDRRTFTLDDPSKALYLPKGIWGEQKYITEDTLLMVMCNTKYSYDDYIFDYDKFLKFRGLS
tara:strand:+ start:194 stop:610 length:417 start_codon:yes stop_codon:yes gene_type:complete